MPEVTSHASGAPSWAELATTDEAGALAFYSALFGWQDDPEEISPGWHYHMQRLNGLEAASIYRQSEAEREQNMGLALEHSTSPWRTWKPAIAETVGCPARCSTYTPVPTATTPAPTPTVTPRSTVTPKPPTRRHGWNELMTTDREAAIEFYIKVLVWSAAGWWRQ